MPMIARRSFLTGLSILAAPAIIRTPGLLMPVKAQPAGTCRSDRNGFTLTLISRTMATMQTGTQKPIAYCASATKTELKSRLGQLPSTYRHSRVSRPRLISAHPSVVGIRRRPDELDTLLLSRSAQAHREIPEGISRVARLIMQREPAELPGRLVGVIAIPAQGIQAISALDLIEPQFGKIVRAALMPSATPNRGRTVTRSG